MDLQALQAMKDIDIRTVETSTLVDFSDVVIKTDLPKPERMVDYFIQARNPYCLKCGKIAVKILYSDTDTLMDDLILSYMRTI